MDASAYEEKLDRAIELSRQATERDKAGAFAEAFELYKAALDSWHLLCRCQTNALLKAKLYRKMGEYVARAEVLKNFLEKQKQHALHAFAAAHPAPGSPSCGLPFSSAVAGCCSPSPPSYADCAARCSSSSRSSPFPHLLSSLPASRRSRDGGDGCGCTGSCRADDSEEDKIREKLLTAIVTEKPEVRWHHIAGLEAAKEALQEAVILPSRFPSLFTGERTPWRGILLYGPPGTGKTFLAKAVAAEAQATFLSVSSADLVSKWQGESEKLVRSLFAMARERRPSIIFIDEIDSMCGARSEGDSDSSRRIKTEFLVQMQGLQKDAPGVLVLGATNVPWALDSAIRRRFERRVYIPLPDLRARLQLVSLSLGTTPHQLGDAEFDTLARQTEGFSGADISVVVRDALFQPLRKCRAATHFKRVFLDGTHFLSPCPPGDSDPSKVEMRLMEVPPNRLLPPELSMEDFIAVLRNARPSVSEEDIRRHEEWTRRFGVEGQ
ncbi:vacuolar protein sorting-associated protein vps4, putative [Toxoplasma gondii ME49]|uniref:Vacuolar protein sorting-associated protein vps4 n=22 Tax=Toxoplasma gondii TaxID=5811 RepID=B9QA65_TOXGV|nr:vacuolar protein sorting-associated protein vps4, putative [Toxoplasma gondii ME49]EPR58789.1 putative vacuolar protein sorting-associated protein vps4 [Toxoplasma gondii GT1]ESS35326.1 putative vacuolar protein sorting-associated protein vps4 [Toxoplasma gondii VEG]KFG36724.1 putative vacuolar protein sorting-associated protein vps4 [Toxoplasma gondii GAB2-2007-GAL-DOM2]KFH02056.1 putative vacuolar protein sorting-associated protein vps4 [Toxoplasma gondii VAND]EPT25717.1 vacuolar protein |eukprot:XP_018635315.1 vacuolar protein sorting-associated protein vps4, putative [Toxoplasma gondii ME49]